MKTVDRARGRWKVILPLLGIDPQFLRNKHGPCPLCGGRDRFRFDDKEGSGSYYCNGCGAGNGIILLRKLHGWNFKQAADAVDGVICDFVPNTIPPLRTERNQATTNRQKIESVISSATDHSIVVDYLRCRGLSTFPDVLLGHPGLPYFDGTEFAGKFPAMIAPIWTKDGELRSVHRTYLAGAPCRRKIMPPISRIIGCSAQLFPPATHIGVAEGIETSLAPYELFGVPTWAAISAYGIATDNDSSFVGQKAAYVLAHRLARAIQIDVQVPPKSGSDWLDVLVDASSRSL
jgi:putative DNA primase/helicase